MPGSCELELGSTLQGSGSGSALGLWYRMRSGIPQHKSPLAPSTHSWCHSPRWATSSRCRWSWPSLCLSWCSGSSISVSSQGPAAWKAGGGDGCNRAEAGPWRVRPGAASRTAATRNWLLPGLRFRLASVPGPAPVHLPPNLALDTPVLM